MSKKYVSLAIDHGTTNSCIARMTPQGPEVLPAEGSSPILPSAVFYDSHGGLRVGSDARNAMLTAKDGDGQGVTAYKLQIGSDVKYEFAAAGKQASAPELGAIIIQTLLRAHQRATGDDAHACVITIPAKFKQNSVEGTRMAAEMAGLRYSPLIMEPVAAAMRYGFTAGQQRAQWMVFDLGGGTLDVSLVIARQGKLVVPDGGHAGDDNLGGRYFDQELAGYVLDELEHRYQLTAFRNERKRFQNQWGRLLLAVEAAKIDLSTRAESVVSLDTPLCRDDQGKEVEVKVPVARKKFEDLIRPAAERAVQICKTLLKSNRLSATQVERLILVGGPSKTPLILGMLRDRLGIKLEDSIDPMTAVAEGAAIWADTVEIPGNGDGGGPKAGYRLQMDCQRQSTLPSYQAVGIVEGGALDGLQVEVERLDGLWKSAGVPVDQAGVFMVELRLKESQRPTLSEFRTTLLDRHGRILASAQEPQIWFPSMGLENRLANSLRVAVKGNATKTLIEPGAELPASNADTFLTSKALRRGSGDDVLRVAVLESVTNLLGRESELASCCLHVGTLRILGHEVSMDVPAGSEIEVRLSVDESRNIRATAYIPLLDQEFQTSFVGESFQYALADLAERVGRALYEFAEVEKLHGERGVPEVAEAMDIIRQTKLVETLAADLKRAEAGEKESEVRAYKRVLELESTIRDMQRFQRRARFEVSVQTLRGLTHGAALETLDGIERDYAKVASDDDLAHCMESLGRLEFSLRGRPWTELLIDIFSLGGLKVNPRQHEAFNKAVALRDRIDEHGGLGKATDADIAEVQRMHLELAETYPDLYEHRNKFLSEHGKGGADIDLSDLESLKK